MTNIVVKIRDGVATAELTGILTNGMVGVPVFFDLGPEWEDLTVIAVIRGNDLTFDRPLLGTRQTTVPFEVLEKVGEHIYIGAEGCSASGDLVIQSNMAKVEEPVRQGADPSGDIAMDPTQPFWAELMEEVENLQEMTREHEGDPDAHRAMQQRIGTLETSKLNVSDIADDLDTKDPARALSANMGNVLKEKIANDLLTAQKNLEAEIKQRVKTVNGISPDANGNVVVQGGSGDGFSPVANVTQTDSGAVITVTDKSGTSTATVFNGKTPEKGVDYFTEAEKQEIAEQAAGMVEVSGGNGGADSVEVLLDFTTTENVTEFHVPIPNAEIAKKLNDALEIRLYLSVPRDASDTTITTTGKAQIGINRGWNVLMCNVGVIPAPSTTWVGRGDLFVQYTKAAMEGVVDGVAAAISQYGLRFNNQSPSGGVFYYENAFCAAAGKYFFVIGTQTMAAGTRLIVGVRK